MFDETKKRHEYKHYIGNVVWGWFVAIGVDFNGENGWYLHKDGNVYPSTVNPVTKMSDGYWETEQQAIDAYQAWVGNESSNTESTIAAYERAMKIL